MRTPKNLIYHTFIGLHVKVIKSSSHALENLEGKIVDETKNLIVIERAKDGKDKKEVQIPKIACTFRFSLDGGSHLDVDGKTIAFRPEERAKKV